MNKITLLPIPLILLVILISGCTRQPSFSQVKCEIVCSDMGMKYLEDGTTERCDVYNYVICHCWKQQSSLIQGSSDEHKFVRIDCVDV